MARCQSAGLPGTGGDLHENTTRIKAKVMHRNELYTIRLSSEEVAEIKRVAAQLGKKPRTVARE